MDIPFLAPQGQGYSAPANAQRTINFYGVVDPASKRKVALYGVPGCRTWETVGDGPIRNMIEHRGIGYVVSGDEFYTIDVEGNSTLRGTLITATGAVTIITNGLQVLVADGIGNVTYLDNYGIIKPGGNLYVYDIATATFAPVSPPSSVSNETFYITSLADFTTIDALDFASAESSPDDLVRVFADHGELLLFGSNSIEPWQNTGDSEFPFARLGSTRIERGTAAINSIVKCDNTTMFLGDDLNFYRLEGYQAVRISTEQVELSMGRMLRVSDAISFTYDQEGHKFYCTSFPSAGVTWCYDVATQFWHERSSSGAEWRASCYMKLGGRDLIGDSKTGKLLELSTQIYDDDGEAMVSSHTMPIINKDMMRLNHNRFELDIESGVGTEAGLDPKVILDWSDDGGRTWSFQLERSFGKIGEYSRRAVWTRLGSSCGRNYRVSISAPVKRVLLGVSLDVAEAGGR